MVLRLFYNFLVNFSTYNTPVDNCPLTYDFVASICSLNLVQVVIVRYGNEFASFVEDGRLTEARYVGTAVNRDVSWELYSPVRYVVNVDSLRARLQCSVACVVSSSPATSDSTFEALVKVSCEVAGCVSSAVVVVDR